ncbi:WXG100 family type VII secretion target [Actinokineospora bangkokensis]|uniref:Uncharacterized protein n=1 Tax=Actinokineospora bangkokensis TaxID=1193682 RepID=A0A1Q9LHD6_9PSEU|nr:hypothetical protein [Actinokineospora bangkokensis]OLR91424.1 hypothetical protein BJP25_00885 [Actinokineospora bangkokensis]
MSSYAEIRTWDADGLEDVAQAVRGRKDRVLGLQDELDMSFGPLAWHGENAAGARDTLGTLRDRAEHVVAEAAHVQRALEQAADAVQELRRGIDDLEGVAQANRFSIGADGSVHDQAPDSGDPAARAALGRALADGVTKAMTTAGEIDTALAEALAAAAGGKVSDNGATTLAEADTAYTADGEYHTGKPQKPEITYDEDFAYDTEDPTLADHVAKAKWLAQLRGAQLLGYLPDGTATYEHYWSNTGTPMELDYAKAYREDSGIRASVDTEVARAARAAEELIAGGQRDFSMTGGAHPISHQPQTENWQKAIGGHQLWSHGDVRVEGNRVTMEVTVEAEDRYNFNRGQADIATGAPDDANGRFTEVGWAKPFDTHGTITKTITWELGNPPAGLSDDPTPSDREVRGTERDRGPTPDNPREPERNRAR